MVRNIPGFEDPQQRVLALTLPSRTAMSAWSAPIAPTARAWVPTNTSTSWPGSRACASGWPTRSANTRLAVLGDYNVAPADEDVHNPEKWEGQVLVSEPERNAFRALLDLGLTDSFRLFPQPEKSFSWWDYRQFGFRRNAGLRIDHVLLSALVKRCVACDIDKEPRRNEQPSDHAPVIATLSFE